MGRIRRIQISDMEDKRRVHASPKGSMKDNVTDYPRNCNRFADSILPTDIRYIKIKLTGVV